MALDLVCGMHVERSSEAVSITYDRRRFFFCSKGCRDRFLQWPQRFLGREDNDRSRT
jgi:YHS domain-containing protein